MGEAWLTGRRSSVAGAVLIICLNGSSSFAAGLDGPGQTDLRRAFLIASTSTSEEPAVRNERRIHEPSAGFMLGAALGAWTSARGQLDFDLNNPAAAGPPHMSQTGDNDDALRQDCTDEKTAFERLEARASGLGLDAQTILTLSGAPNADQLQARWQARRAGPDRACR